MKKILVSLAINDITLEILESAGYQVEVSSKNASTQKELIDLLQNYQGFIGTGSELIDRKLLTSCNHLEVISLYSAGYNNVDIKCASKLGIPVYNSAGMMSKATADIAFFLMLAVSRKVTYFQKLILQNEWSKLSDTVNLGVELHSKTLGIFGMGKIGIQMAKRCKGAYNMTVLYHNRTRNKKAEKELDATYVDFKTLVSNSDILSVHCPLSEETKHLFDLSIFDQMKPNSIFINTARGAVHHESDLIKALKSKTIMGAGLDVTDPEPIDPKSDLLHMDNVIVLPHIGSATVEARTAMAQNAAENIVRFYHSRSTINLVNKDSLDNRDEHS